MDDEVARPKKRVRFSDNHEFIEPPPKGACGPPRINRPQAAGTSLPKLERTKNIRQMYIETLRAVREHAESEGDERLLALVAGVENYI